MGGEFKYWAFVSYNHNDKAWSTWLHRQLDGYRPPRRLVGRATRDGKIPTRMLPVFRDREDLAGAPSLNDSLHANLRASQYLVVVCSPNSAASTHVNDEVKYFKSLGREDRVFCFIVGGSPSATDHACCYPPAVRTKYDSDGQPTSETAHPLAPDARPQGDDRRKARTKLIAGLLGVDNDELERREWWRTFWKRVRLGSAIIAAITVIGILGQIVWSSRIDYLTDLGRKELLEGSAASALRSLSGAYALGKIHGSVTPALRFLLHQAKLAQTSGPTKELLQDNVWCADFSPDGTRVVTASSKGSAIVWDSKTGKVVRIFTGDEDHKGLNGASFSSNGKNIITACTDGTASIWEVETGNPASFVLDVGSRAKGTNVFPALFDWDGGKVVTACTDVPAAVIWDVTNKPPLGTLIGHSGTNRAPKGVSKGIHYANFSPDGRLVVTAGMDGIANIWDTSSGHLITPLKPAEHERREGLRCAVFSPDGRRIATCGYNGEARLWRLDGSLIRKLSMEPKDNHARRAAFSADGKILVLTSSTGAPTVWNGETGDSTQTLNFPNKQMTWCVAINKAGLIAVAGDKNLMVWDASYRSLRIEKEAHSGKIFWVEFSADGNCLASSGEKGEAYIWNVSDGKSVSLICQLKDKGLVGRNYLSLSGHSSSNWVTSIYSDRTGRYVLTIDSTKTLRGWQKSNDAYQMLDPFPMGAESVVDVAFDSEGKLLVVGEGGESKAVTIWDVERRTKVAEYDFGGEITSVDFGPKQNRIVVTGVIADVPTLMVAEFDRPRMGKPLFLPRILEKTAPAFNRAGDKFIILNQQRVAEVRRTFDSALIAAFGTGIKAASFYGDDTRILTVSEADQNATIWRLDSERAIPMKTFGLGKIQYAAISPDGSRIVTLCEGKHAAAIWDALDGTPLFELEGDDQMYEVTGSWSRPLFAEFSPDGALVVTQTSSMQVRVWDAHTGKLLTKTDKHDGIVTAVAFSADGTKLFTGAQDPNVKVTDMSYETDAQEQVSTSTAVTGK